MKTRLIIAVVVVVAVSAAFFLGFLLLGVGSNAPASSTGIANPASTNCVDLGGQLEIKDEVGGQVGYCHLQDGRVCEEWSLYRDKTCVVPQTDSSKNP